jgi:hypothetical protein
MEQVRDAEARLREAEDGLRAICRKLWNIE